ncbi:hypothetical protein [Brevundimonas goettingensis]|uniref:Uncharacterized protein n=1 Tax=Brevundimonas goettingensis TaxID=2774190 RepID=A0A975BYF1_9CAUL|nr:hypothetical protein [Brevundimonas goettingensis]QTC89988.1 hypothetical protein IFJ75_11875 [Brevundimonas goettingensis]
MAFPNDNRTIIAIGAGLVVIAAVVAGLVFAGGGDKTPEAPPASRGGLNIDLAEAPVLETTRELRCFVNGQFVGMATLADCARRNGLATDALDVGLDETGALAAAPTAAFAPPPAAPAAEPVVEAPAAATPTDAHPAPAQTAIVNGSPCLRYTGNEWRTVSTGTTLGQCVQALYAGQCVGRPGDAQYGRWGDQTLRLVPRRVEQSSDNSRFRVLAEQDRSCQFPGLN